MEIPANPILDERVQARRQKDLDGFIEAYQDIVDKRTAKYADEIKDTWGRVDNYLGNATKDLYDKYAVDGKLPDGRLWEAERLGILQQHTAYISKELHGDASRLQKNLVYQYTEAYYYSAFKTEQTAKVAIHTPVLSHSQVMGVVSNPWLPDGRNYSDRIRANTGLLAVGVKSSIEQAISEGLSVQETARLIQEKTGEGYNNAVRLARTELNRAAAQGQTQSFLENADILDGKRWNAVLDKHTAPKDAANDGKLYALDYDTEENPGKPGERIPNHPNCRCKWSPVLSALGVSTKERIARDKEGKRTYVKARTYEEYAEEVGLPLLPDRLRNDNPKRYLRNGETVNDYAAAIGKTVEAFLQTRNGAALAAAIAPAAEAAIFTPAATVAEATAWAQENLPIPTVDYTEYDLRLANEVNEELQKLYTLYPEVDGIKYLGTTQQRNKLEYQQRVDYWIEANGKDKLERIAEQRGTTIEDLAKKYVKRARTVSANTYAKAAPSVWGDLAGVTYNRLWAKDYDKIAKAIKEDVKSGWHPVGTESPASILIHEFGHMVDYMLIDAGIRDKYLTPITKEVLKLSKKELRDQLSEYAGTNHMEVIAEAFAEYHLSKNPRKWARKIGEAIDEAMNEYRKGR